MRDYIRSVAHSKNAVQVENKRCSLIQDVAAVRAATARQPGFDGNTTFLDSLVHYLTLHIILTEDYGRIVDTEEVAGQRRNGGLSACQREGECEDERRGVLQGRRRVCLEA